MMEESDFFLTVSSLADVSLYKKNDPGQFKNQLPTNIHIDKDSYECGLSEIILTNNFNNVSDGEIWVELVGKPSKDDKYKTYFDKMVVQGGYYGEIGDLLSALNEVIRRGLQKERVEKEKGLVLFKYDKRKDEVFLVIREADWLVRLSDHLTDMLGFRMGLAMGPKVVHAIKPPNFHRDQTPIFVYSSLVEHRFVGGTKTPLLRVFPQLSYLEKNKIVIHNKYDRPHYVNVATSTLSLLDVYLCFLNGEVLKFGRGGYCIATLHFRRKKY